MDAIFDFDPDKVIRRKKYILPGQEVTAVFHQRDDGRFIIAFIKGMEVIRRVDVTEDWLTCKDVKAVDTFISNFVSHVSENHPW